MIQTKCRVCGNENNSLVYNGPIRGGGIGSSTVDGHQIYQCSSCKLAFLYPIPEHLDDFYESEQYRSQFFDETDVASMQRKYDREQSARVSRIGVEVLRNKVVADFGAGPGLFLDAVQGVAKKTIAIEPTRLYQEYFKLRGHSYYSYAKELIDAAEKVDVAVSFDTIEHILDLREFTKQIYDILTEKGIFFLSMPNYMDMVRLICPESYEPFFYQVSHLNYFCEDPACLLLKNTGFRNISVGYLHKYNINNILQWTKTGKPGALNTGSAFDVHFHNVYCAEIERLGIASHLFIVASKGL
jgi:2-polyprenyl-3-methyl-5-hydroxy-6-metoxy-1,4-benzoquinol methylase